MSSVLAQVLEKWQGFSPCLRDDGHRAETVHFRRGLRDQGRAALQGANIPQSQPHRAIGAVSVPGWDGLRIDRHLLQSADGDEGFLPPVFHPLE
jgi:hypothetical protein